MATNVQLYDHLYGEGHFDQVEAETEFFHPSSEGELYALIADFEKSQSKDA